MDDFFYAECCGNRVFVGHLRRGAVFGTLIFERGFLTNPKGHPELADASSTGEALSYITQHGGDIRALHLE